MVTLFRRLVVLLVAAIAGMSVAGSAFGATQDVINDFLDNGVIDSCHAKADYDGARAANINSPYGDPQGAIDDALDNPERVGTADTPCPPKTAGPSDSGSNTAIAIVIPVALGIIALAVFVGRKRGGGGDPDAGDDARGAA